MNETHRASASKVDRRNADGVGQDGFSIGARYPLVATVSTLLWLVLTPVVFHPGNGLSIAWNNLLRAGNLAAALLSLASPRKIVLAGETLSAHWILGVVRSWPAREVLQPPVPGWFVRSIGAQELRRHGKLLLWFWPRSMSGGLILVKELAKSNGAVEETLGQ